MPKQSWLDRLVRGRAWIPVVGVSLLAVVGIRVEILKLSSGMAAQLQTVTELQSANADLHARVSALSSNQRIQRLAGQLGMVMPGPMDLHFVPGSAGTHVEAAVRAISAPEPSAFLEGVVAERGRDQMNANDAANTSAVGDLSDGYASPSPSTPADVSPGTMTAAAGTQGPDAPPVQVGTTVAGSSASDAAPSDPNAGATAGGVTDAAPTDDTNSAVTTGPAGDAPATTTPGVAGTQVAPSVPATSPTASTGAGAVSLTGASTPAG